MGVISFASLKGGVGKTSLSINVSHAFARRGCETLLIDLDPIAHTTRFFSFGTGSKVHGPKVQEAKASLAKLFLSRKTRDLHDEDSELLAIAEELECPVQVKVRDNLDLVPGGSALRHFLSHPGSNAFKHYFPQIISELKETYDQIVIDTAPDFDVLTRNVFAVSDIVVVPVDNSEMSIFCLEEILANASHIKEPSWAIVRSMVNKQASRVQRLSDGRLNKNYHLQAPNSEVDSEEDEPELEDFIDTLKSCEKKNGTTEASAPSNDKPIFLLDSVIYRTEEQNRLSFEGATAFDRKRTDKLAKCYWSVAKELEDLLSHLSPIENNSPSDDFYEDSSSSTGHKLLGAHA